MKRCKLIFCLGVLVTILCSASPAFSANLEPTYQETKDLMVLVRDAAGLVQNVGAPAFSDFRKQGSRWLGGERYIFVIDTKGNVYVNPSRPELEGKNQLNLRDLVGRPFIKSFINETTAYPQKSEGWTHYVWIKPGQDQAQWKTSYVKLVKAQDGKEYIVGSGLYNMKMERVFVVDVVDEAAELVKKQGKAAFPRLRDPLGDFNYLSTYVFVIDAKGHDLVNPAFPGFEGQAVLNLKDSTGKPFIRDMLKSLETADTVWIEYMWPKPRQAAPSKKSSYVRKVTTGSEVFYVGSGSYLD